MIQAATKIDLTSDFNGVVDCMKEALKVMKEGGDDYQKALAPMLVLAQKNLAIYYYGTKKYSESIDMLVALKKSNEFKEMPGDKEIDPTILSAYCQIAHQEKVDAKDNKKTLESAFAFISDEGNKSLLTSHNEECGHCS